MDFNFYIPTKIIMGPGCVVKNSNLFSKTGSRALIVSYPANLQNDSINDVQKALEIEGIPYFTTLDSPVNPEMGEMQKFADLASSNGADMIIGIGGGSVLDTAKTAAVLTVNKIQLDDLYKNAFPVKPLPVITIPTTSGTGSEVTPYAVLSIKEKKTKKSFGNEELLSPVYAFLDATYTITLPGQVAADSAVDALSHGIEGYLSKNANWVSDMLGKTIFTNFKDCGKSLEKRKFSFEQREKLLFNSTLSGIMINHMRTLAVHAMSYPLTINRNLSHGCSCGVLLGAFMKYIYPECSSKADSMYRDLGISSTGEFSYLIDSILDYTEKYSLKELEQYTEECFKAAASKPNPRNIDRKAVLEIYKNALLGN